MDSVRKAIFGKSKHDSSSSTAAPVAAPVVTAQPAYSAAPQYPSYPSHATHHHQPQHGQQHGHQPPPYQPVTTPYPAQHMPYPPAAAASGATSAGPHPPVAAPRHHAAGQTPYPASQQQHHHHQQQHQGPYPGQSHPQAAPRPAPRSNAPNLPQALRSMQINRPAMERTMSSSGSAIEGITVEISPQYSNTSTPVPFPVGWRVMEPPDLDKVNYDFALERKVLRL